MNLDPKDVVEASNLIIGALERMARQCGEDAANIAATKNIHGNVAYLLTSLGEMHVIDMLGELRERVLHAAFDRAHRAR